MSITAVFLLQGCDKKGPGDNYDFSNSLPPYVALTSTDPINNIKAGASATVTFTLKTTMQQIVTVNYKVEGAVNLPSQSVAIKRDEYTGVATVPIPATAIVAPATTATATLTLVSATKADGTVLTIGPKNDAATQKVVINIIK